MRELEQGVAANVMLFIGDPADPAGAGKASLTLSGTVTLKKDGSGFASISPTITDRGNGFYEIALTASHTDTVGDLVLRAAPTGGLPGERVVTVAANPQITGSVSDATPAAGAFNTDLSYSDNVLNGMMLYFIGGNLKGIGRKITSFANTNGACTFSGSTLDAPFPSAPADGDQFILISFGG